MEFIETSIPGAYVITPVRLNDERGFFARLLCERELAEQGLETTVRQTNIGVSHIQGTLRGMHYQRDPDGEVKIVRCPRGRIFDVIVDLRKDSSSYLDWYGIELDQENNHALYVPAGCAHGYMTLADNTEVYYHTSQFYAPKSVAGVRWDDPAFGIEWPMKPVEISNADRSWCNFSEVESGFSQGGKGS